MLLFASLTVGSIIPKKCDTDKHKQKSAGYFRVTAEKFLPQKILKNTKRK